MLAQGMGALKREVLTSYDARAAALSALRKATNTRLARLAEKRAKRATQQHATLARGHSDLTTRVRRDLREQQAARHAGATQQHATLARGRSDLTTGEAVRRSGVTAAMQSISADRVTAHQTWQSLAVAMGARRTQAATPKAPTPASGGGRGTGSAAQASAGAGGPPRAG